MPLVLAKPLPLPCISLKQWPAMSAACIVEFLHALPMSSFYPGPITLMLTSPLKSFCIFFPVANYNGLLLHLITHAASATIDLSALHLSNHNLASGATHTQFSFYLSGHHVSVCFSGLFSFIPLYIVKCLRPTVRALSSWNTLIPNLTDWALNIEQLCLSPH